MSAAMDVAQLRSFASVAEAGSYIKAADLLGTPQPTLSRQVRALEVELRANLFHRHGRGVRLTPAGSKFLEYTRSVLRTIDAAVLSVRNTDAEYSGPLVIGLTPSIGRILIPTLAPRLVEHFPRASISLTEGLSGALYEKVLLGQLDFALLLSPAASPSIRIEPLATEVFYLVGQRPAGAQAASITLAELAQLPLILPHGNQWTRPALETASSRLGLRPNIVLEVDATFSTLALAAQGVGWSIMPGNLRRLPQLPQLSWQKIVQPQLEATISQITPTRQPRSPLAKAAELVTREALRDLLACGMPPDGAGEASPGD